MIGVAYIEIAAWEQGDFGGAGIERAAHGIRVGLSFRPDYAGACRRLANVNERRRGPSG